MDAAAAARLAHLRCLRLPTDHTERVLLTYRTAKGQLRTVVDVTIYSMNRPMRMAFSCKRNKPHPLLPVLGSSDNIAAHLVNLVPPEHFVPPQHMPPLDLDAVRSAVGAAEAALKKSDAPCVGLATEGDADDPPEALEATPLWQPAQISTLRRDLLANADIARRLGVEHLVLGDEKTSADGSAHFFYVKRTNGDTYATCPYAGHAHSSNNLSLVYNHDRRRLFVHCFKAECSFRNSGKRRVSWPVAFASDMLEAAAAAEGGGDFAATLHACEHLVQFREGDNYCEERMRPYPDDRLVAVRAGMGTGGFRAPLHGRARAGAVTASKP